MAASGWSATMIKSLSTLICQVADMNRAVEFYRDVLGLTPGTLSPYWSDLRMADGTMIGLHPPFTGGRMPDGSGWVLGVEVDDVRAFRAKLEAAGRSVTGYHDVPGGVVIEFTDFDGNPIQAIQMGITSKDLT